MALRLKKGLDPEILRKYGFKTGKEWADAGERCMNGCEYMYDWYHKFLMDPDEPDTIMYVEEDNDIVMVRISVRIDFRGYKNDIYIDCSPLDSYHIGGDELDMITDTLFDMIEDGILERE